MNQQVIRLTCRAFVCTTAHPTGCEAVVGRQAHTAYRAPESWRRGNLLVLGASTGYGLASRIAGAFGHGMDSVGVAYERPMRGDRTASPGWYNSAAFGRMAKAQGLKASAVIGDAFSRAVLAATLDDVRRTLGPLDVVVYSLASPMRKDPETGEVYRSSLKTVGAPATIKTIDLRTDEVVDVTIQPASEEEIAGTVAVMGGDDLRRWVNALLAADLLAPGARVVAYSYVGPRPTWPIYREGTIGRAKADMEAACAELDRLLSREIDGRCLVSVNKSVVTQAAAAIPGVPLLMSILFRVMKERGVHEGPIEQMMRLFDDHIGAGREPTTDELGRIRLDDLEMRADIQEECMRRWERVDTTSLYELSDYAGFQRYFESMFGFGVPGVDYEKPVDIDVPIPDAVEIAS